MSGDLEFEIETTVLPQAIPLVVLYEDDDLLVIDKQAGLVAHPAAGNRDGTLVNALLHRAPELAALPRAGLVHRLIRTPAACWWWRAARERTPCWSRRCRREPSRGSIWRRSTACRWRKRTVDAPVGRHPVDRQRMAVTAGGKPAVTHYRVRRFRAHALLRVKLETGRTHQIRVHMAHIRFPLLGDPVYGGRPRIPPNAAPACIAAIQGFRRQALHAERLAFPIRSPASGWNGGRRFRRSGGFAGGVGRRCGPPT